MDDVMRRSLSRLQAHGLAGGAGFYLGSLDASISWNDVPPQADIFAATLNRLNASALVFGKPLEPYRSMVAFLADAAIDAGADAVTPRDSETRTFLHRLPCAPSFGAEALLARLGGARAAIFADGTVAAQGAVSVEEAAVFYSSACFSVYVKFMADCLEKSRSGNLCAEEKRILRLSLGHLERLPSPPVEPHAPFHSEAEVVAVMARVGRDVVRHRLVDSAFGNVSLLWNNTLYISQTGAALDCLEGQIDACPLDGSRSTGITASSELPAHLEIVKRTAFTGVLHGHPRFAVILSLDCDRQDCENRTRCHTHCQQERSAGGAPIVCGEVGSGPFGLFNTVPQALSHNEAVIVLGHGVFAGASGDFNGALAALFAVENACMDAFVERISRSSE